MRANGLQSLCVHCVLQLRHNGEAWPSAGGRRGGWRRAVVVVSNSPSALWGMPSLGLGPSHGDACVHAISTTVRRLVDGVPLSPDPFRTTESTLWKKD